MSYEKRNYKYLWVVLLIVVAAGLYSSISIAQEPLDPLTESVLSNDIALVRKWLEVGVDVNASSKSGTTPLILASEHGQTEIIKLLLDADAKVNAKGLNNSTALMLAAAEGYPVDFLVDIEISFNIY